MNCVTFLRGFLWLIDTRTKPEKLPHLCIHDMYWSKSSTGWRKIEKNQTRKRRFFLWRIVSEIWVVAPVDSFHPYWVNATVQRGKRKGSRIQMHGCEETRNQWFWTKGGGEDLDYRGNRCTALMWQKEPLLLLRALRARRKELSAGEGRILRVEGNFNLK